MDAKGMDVTRLLLVVVFVVLHALAILLLPAHAMAASYAFMVAAPTLALVVVIRRCWTDGWVPSNGWSLLAASLVLWTFGILSSLRQDLFLDNSSIAPVETMLLYILFGVPITYAVATIGDERTPVSRGVDAVLALVLGYLYFRLTYSFSVSQTISDAESARLICALLDGENLFLAVTAVVRLLSSDTLKERAFFKVLALFSVAYALTVMYYNHAVALGPQPAFGSLHDLVIDLPFLLLIVMAGRRTSPLSTHARSSAILVRVVRSGSPLLLVMSVLVVALFLMRQRFALGVAGVLTAVLAYALRSVLAQIRQSATVDALEHDRSMLAELARHDPLTGAHNRRAFEEALARGWSNAAERRESLAVLVIDIDFFKHYNDRYGHPAGDSCLHAVATALQHITSRSAGFLARYGGEEFLLLLPDTPLESAQAVAEQARTAVAQLPIAHLDGVDERVTVSIGIACTEPARGGCADDLVAAADAALYEAKRRGRNRSETAP